MQNILRQIAITCALLTIKGEAWAQAPSNRELKFNFNEDGSHYLKATFTGQVWLRANESNPGTTVNGFAAPQTFDIGLRRVRTQLFGKINDHVFFYTQFGINNFDYNATGANRKPGLFFHDLLIEYQVTPRALQIGAGLTGWSAFSRYSNASISSLLTCDVPLYQESTNDVNDQFVRKLSIYAKGKLGKLDYRLMIADPLLVDASITNVQPINVNSDFSYKNPKWQTSSYFMQQFLEEESNLIPATTGSYLGKKKIFNIGAGFQYQPDAMWHYGDAVAKDTILSDMFHYTVDVFFDHPLGTKGAAITAYAAYSKLDYGKNYIRSSGPMNPAPIATGTSFSGGGSAFPLFGTGSVYFAQVGYLIPSSITGERLGRLQPYAQMMLARYDRLNDNMVVWDAGFNWLIEGHRSKITLNYQNRPAFSTTDLKQSERKSMIVLQLQVAI